MDLNEEEKKLCKQFRGRISDLKITESFRIMDFNVIRFLRARNMDIDKAEDMFRKYITWRVENDIDNAKTWDISQDLKDNFHYRITGLNQNGGLVICVNIGDWNPLITSGRYDELMRVAFHELENITQFTRYFSLQRNTFSKMVAIINLEGLTFAHCSTVEWIRALITLLKAFEAYYPETLKQAYLLSAPWVFTILWSICKPFISTATHDRLKFLGSDMALWKSEITQFVDEDQFPATFGGTLPEDCEMYLEEDGTVKRRLSSSDTKTANTQHLPDTISQKPVDSIELD